MGWKDQVTKTFEKAHRPQFEYKRVEIKEKVFTFYNSDTKERENIEGAITGIVFGYAYQLSAFDSKYSKNGGTYNSAFIFDWEQNVVVFSPAGTRVYDGDYKGAKEFIGATADSPTKFRIVFFVRTESETYAIYSNGIIGIDQISEFGARFTGNLATFTPAALNFKEPQISKRALRNFEKIKKLGNPPIFAHITLADQITTEIEGEYNIGQVVADYVTWKDSYVKLKPIEEVEDTTYEHEVRESVQATDTDKGTDIYDIEGKEPAFDNDLPF